MDDGFIKQTPNDIDAYIEACRTPLNLSQWWGLFNELLHILDISSMDSIFQTAQIHDTYIKCSGLIFIFDYSLHSPWNELTQDLADHFVGPGIDQAKQVIVTNGLAFHVYTGTHLLSGHLKTLKPADGLNLESTLASIHGYRSLLMNFLDRTING